MAWLGPRRTRCLKIIDDAVELPTALPDRAQAGYPADVSNSVLGLRCGDVRPQYPEYRAGLRLLARRHNFAADRELADRMLNLVPPIAVCVIENRQFLSRAVTWAANEGIGQFIDLGCGMPTVPNTQETGQAIAGDARVVYVDNDPVASDVTSAE